MYRFNRHFLSKRKNVYHVFIVTIFIFVVLITVSVWGSFFYINRRCFFLFLLCLNSKITFLYFFYSLSQKFQRFLFGFVLFSLVSLFFVFGNSITSHRPQSRCAYKFSTFTFTKINNNNTSYTNISQNFYWNI